MHKGADGWEVLWRKLAGGENGPGLLLHDMDFAASYFERIIVMAHGRVLADGPKDQTYYEMDAPESKTGTAPCSTCSCLGYEELLTVEDMAGCGIWRKHMPEAHARIRRILQMRKTRKADRKAGSRRMTDGEMRRMNILRY